MERTSSFARLSSSAATMTTLVVPSPTSASCSSASSTKICSHGVRGQRGRGGGGCALVSAAQPHLGRWVLHLEQLENGCAVVGDCDVPNVVHQHLGWRGAGGGGRGGRGAVDGAWGRRQQARRPRPPAPTRAPCPAQPAPGWSSGCWTPPARLWCSACAHQRRGPALPRAGVGGLPIPPCRALSPPQP